MAGYEIDVSVLGLAGVTVGQAGPFNIADPNKQNQKDVGDTTKAIVGFLSDDRKEVVATTGFSGKVSYGPSGNIMVPSATTDASGKDVIHRNTFRDLVGLQRFTAVWGENGSGADEVTRLPSSVAFDAKYGERKDFKLLVALAPSDPKNSKSSPAVAKPIAMCEFDVISSLDSSRRAFDVPIRFIGENELYPSVPIGSTLGKSRSSDKGFIKRGGSRLKLLGRSGSLRARSWMSKIFKGGKDNESIEDGSDLGSDLWSDLGSDDGKHMAEAMATTEHLKRVPVEQGVVRIVVEVRKKEMNVEYSLGEIQSGTMIRDTAYYDDDDEDDFAALTMIDISLQDDHSEKKKWWRRPSLLRKKSSTTRSVTKNRSDGKARSEAGPLETEEEDNLDQVVLEQNIAGSHEEATTARYGSFDEMALYKDDKCHNSTQGTVESTLASTDGGKGLEDNSLIGYSDPVEDDASGLLVDPRGREDAATIESKSTFLHQFFCMPTCVEVVTLDEEQPHNHHSSYSRSSPVHDMSTVADSQMEEYTYAEAPTVDHSVQTSKTRTGFFTREMERLGDAILQDCRHIPLDNGEPKLINHLQSHDEESHFEDNVRTHGYSNHKNSSDVRRQDTAYSNPRTNPYDVTYFGTTNDERSFCEELETAQYRKRSAVEVSLVE